MLFVETERFWEACADFSIVIMLLGDWPRIWYQIWKYDDALFAVTKISILLIKDQKAPWGNCK